MTSGEKPGPRQVRMIPLLIPIVFCSALFLIATQGLNLPVPGWAIIAVAYCALWYLLLWVGMRRGEKARELSALESEGRSARSLALARLLRSPGGLLSAALGGWLLWRGDRQLGAVFLGVGMLMLSLSQISRR